jgi:hypothetical protein
MNSSELPVLNGTHAQKIKEFLENEITPESIREVQVWLKYVMQKMGLDYLYDRDLMRLPLVNAFQAKFRGIVSVAESDSAVVIPFHGRNTATSTMRRIQNVA